MERVLGSFFLIGIGALLLVVAWRGYVSGELRAGVAYFRPYRPNRNDNPVAFHFYLILYFCSGMALTVWGILALFGGAPALKLR
ncbi:MAG TPA: hypothetical protein VK460_09075 [Burkholderiales bacterium]|nr:hypothetical protein [Burkholderiales bacterium]